LGRTFPFSLKSAKRLSLKEKFGGGIMNRLIKLAWLALLMCLPAMARAEWKQATTTNFVVYSEGGETQLREFAVKLEKFNFVLRAYHGVTAPLSPIKLKVYLFPNTAAVGKMAGGDGVAGYYISRARGLMMVGSRSRPQGAVNPRNGPDYVDIDSESILLHEYTHHFMYQYFPATYPTWYSEGFAEFWGATNILPGDIVEVGLPVDYRYGSFQMNRWLPIRKLLTAQSYADVPELDLLYAEGWLLVRSAFDDPKQSKQLQAYLKSINGGASYEQAMKDAFDDVGALDSKLRGYAGKSRFQVLRLPFKKIDVGPMTVGPVSPAENAMMELSIELGQGILKRESAEFAGKVRSAARRFADDPFALALLSEAERLAGNRDAAAAAADRLLAAAPDDPRGLLQKALAEMDRLKAASSRDTKAWNSARQYLVRASKVAPNDPLVLEAYYDSYASQGLLPPDPAQAALYQAHELAPSDGDLRYKVAADFEKRDMIREAIAIIRPVAYVLPHRKNESVKEKKRREEREEKYRGAGEVKRETAREMLARLEGRLTPKKGG
jgi:tetratricopeptide (TPR) repeat protein